MAASRTFNALALIGCAMWAASLQSEESLDGPLGVGHLASADAIRARDLTVLPDGAGLPSGRGTARQGAPIYAAQCSACHGDHGEGRAGFPALAGGRGSLASEKPVLTVGSYWPYATTVWDYINRGMPYTDAGSLSADEVYSVTAYVLYLNGIVSEDRVLDRKTLPAVHMPNRDGFIDEARPVGLSVPPAAPTQATTP